ncbi:hypothetical protein [Limisphaera sp. VF-2]|jgi:hypothetical protein|uniref:hypothetical protein n=1 Tax=Limisphaera sp. VF-2 TaxID=3400418 RepID=UPI003C29B11D
MSGEVRVVSFQALEDLDAGLRRFVAVTGEVLEAMEADIQRRLQLLEERRQALLEQVEHHREILDDEQNDELQERAASELKEAEEALRRLEYWQRQANEQYRIFRVHAGRLQALCATSAVKAHGFLERKLAELRSYTEIRTPSFTEPAAATGGVSRTWQAVAPCTRDELKRAIAEGRYQDAIDIAIAIYDIDPSAINGKPRYEPRLDCVGTTDADRCVLIGPAAFRRSPGWLASSIAHEAKHAKDIRDRGFPSNDVAYLEYEIAAYDEEIENADKYGLTHEEVEELRRLKHWYEAERDRFKAGHRPRSSDREGWWGPC